MGEEVKYLLKIDRETWAKFKYVCSLQDIKMKEGLLLAIQEFISANPPPPDKPAK